MLKSIIIKKKLKKETDEGGQYKTEMQCLTLLNAGLIHKATNSRLFGPFSKTSQLRETWAYMKYLTKKLHPNSPL